jgi:predicted nucleotidyltransferase
MENPEDGLQTRIAKLVAACQEILDREAPEGIEAVFLYGSALGPLFRSDSDIDIALLDREDNSLRACLESHDMANRFSMRRIMANRIMVSLVSTKAS